MKQSQTSPHHPLHAQRIEDYAMIGDCETAALVGRNGSIDWLCWPSFSANACFAALLGTKDHGYWKIAPTGKIKATSRRYLPDSLVVETTFTTDSGVVHLLDFMPPRGLNSDVVRIVRCVHGKSRCAWTFPSASTTAALSPGSPARRTACAPLPAPTWYSYARLCTSRAKT